MKFKKIFQKAAAVVMAAVTVFSVLPATTAFAAVGDVGTISFSHTYDGNGNAMRYNSSANINGYIAGGIPRCEMWAVLPRPKPRKALTSL